MSRTRQFLASFRWEPVMDATKRKTDSILYVVQEKVTLMTNLSSHHDKIINNYVNLSYIMMNFGYLG